MKILQTIAGFGAHSGGTSTCTYDLLSAMRVIGCDVDLMTIQSTDLMGKGEAWIKALPNDAITPYGYSRNMNRFLKQNDYDLYHTNGMWMHCNHATCVTARKKDKPYIITPHGMLYPQALARSAWKKKILLNFGGVNQDLRLADCIHCTCKEEMMHYRNLGYKNPVAVIPNPVPVPSFVNDLIHERYIKRIGFLGRLHPRKNVESLLDAWISLGIAVKDARLVIMGKGEPQYEQMLKERVRQHGLKNVEFAGFVTGREKFERLASLTALCVPSDFENFGMIVTEALSVGTPVIASLGTPWEELNTEHCGYWVKNDVPTLAGTIADVLSLSAEEIARMGENGKRLVQAKYKDTQVALMMKQLYEWMLNGREKPDFVYE
ncbi:glycosyl transferase group 1 [Phocaeicola salanitronis DSM 18170]|uniref:Glycosyl transferase group 1 n=1 Tax=Phocaeicola salanitronis (strain DSM 18170 / JCM 13657 / CCUG 60908 / BL78) TaxID=667015 RepID=F0R0F0_PHOSB|nr:glycosyltransferase [Phocaeicola salanitronis]ADY37294.1 glycosyl transferase group 1 [Phocaeicola salanitronis DSM 18170]